MGNKTTIINAETQGEVTGPNMRVYTTPTVPIGVVTPATVAGNVIVDANKGSVQDYVMTANTAFGVSNVPPGRTITLVVHQDGAGGHTATWAAGNQTVAFPTLGPPSNPSAAANAITVYKFTCNTPDGSGVVAN